MKNLLVALSIGLLLSVLFSRIIGPRLASAQSSSDASMDPEAVVVHTYLEPAR